MVEGGAGSNLPDLDPKSFTANTNCLYRIRYGANNWEESSIRQWLNADGEANTWWKPKTVFDRPANVESDGFLRGVDPAFLNVVGQVSKKTQLSAVDGYGQSITEERFFLLSRAEVYGGAERSSDGAESDAYEYYSTYSDLDTAGIDSDEGRIKYKNGSATYWWLRTPYYNGATVRAVYPSGNINSHSATKPLGIAPACAIV